MKTYYVELPLVGSLRTVVEAENEKAAIDKSMEMDWALDLRKNSDPGIHLGDEFTTLRVVAEGNVFYGPLNEATAEAEEED